MCISLKFLVDPILVCMQFANEIKYLKLCNGDGPNLIELIK